MFEDFFDHIIIFDTCPPVVWRKGNYPHGTLAQGTYQGINLIHPVK
jgi:hypothetical protein